MPLVKVSPPKDDDEYFERMTKSIFTAGLNWGVVDKKWPGFRTAFDDFSIAKVAGFPGSRIHELTQNTGIVRNEKKIVATVHNAQEMIKVGKEFGSFKKYLDSFTKDEAGLQEDLQERFEHLGASTSRMFLWSVGYPLTPNAEEKKWLAAHKD